jgi:hypothetical protein
VSASGSAAPAAAVSVCGAGGVGGSLRSAVDRCGRGQFDRHCGRRVGAQGRVRLDNGVVIADEGFHLGREIVQAGGVIGQPLLQILQSFFIGDLDLHQPVFQLPQARFVAGITLS